jgi:hypothetical protein
MAGVEGENRPHQPRQPEQIQPLQGRATGRESLQGPTTVDGSAHGGSDRPSVQQPERRKPQMENPYTAERYLGYLEEMRSLSEKDPKLFATRVMEALDSLLQGGIPGAEQERNSRLEEAISYKDAAGYTIPFMVKHHQYVHTVARKTEAEGYLRGLKSVFHTVHEHITGAEPPPPIQLKFLPGSDEEIQPDPKH